MSIVVQPLVWEHHTTEPEWWAGVHAYERLYCSPDRHRVYTIRRAEGGYSLARELPGCYGRHVYPTLEKAQADAQQEWEIFIRCALANHPDPITTVRLVTLPDRYTETEQRADVDTLLTCDGRGKDAKEAALERLITAAAERGIAITVA